MIQLSPQASGPAPHWIDRFARQKLIERVRKIETGRILLCDGNFREQLGHDSTLSVQIKVNRSRFYRRAVSGPLAMGEAYIDGDWECSDLTALFQIFLRNRHVLESRKGWMAALGQIRNRWIHRFRANSITGSRRNIEYHYDKGNDFYQLWLDRTMAYSSGVFSSPLDSLEQASREKFDRLCRKIELCRHDRVVEIGTGWGGFAIHAAQNYGCHVTTTTISDQQHSEAARRIGDLGLGNRIELLKQDYRQLQGTFDKLVSIEMIEAVGHKYLDSYFKKCGELLRPNGSMALQAIVMPEKRFARYLKSVDFMQRYVFPGGSLPSIASIVESVGRSSDLRVVHIEDMAPHYAETLRRWRSNFESRLDEVRRLGYSESLIRLWRFYLCYCEAGFEDRQIGVLQIQLDKPDCRRDPIRISQLAAGPQTATTSRP